MAKRLIDLETNSYRGFTIDTVLIILPKPSNSIDRLKMNVPVQGERGQGYKLNSLGLKPTTAAKNSLGNLGYTD